MKALGGLKERGVFATQWSRFSNPLSERSEEMSLSDRERAEGFRERADRAVATTGVSDDRSMDETILAANLPLVL